MFTPPNGHFLLTHWFVMAQIFEEVKFQNCIYENKCEAHIIKHFLKELLMQLSTMETKTIAMLPTTLKHLTLTSKYKFVVINHCFLEVLIMIVYFWKSNTDCREVVNREANFARQIHVVWLAYSAVLHPVIWGVTHVACLHALLRLHSSPSWLHIKSYSAF